VHAKGVSSFQFLLEADVDRLNTYLRRYYFDPTRGRVDLRAVGPHVMLQVAATERLDGGDEHYPHNYPSLGPEHSASLLFFATDSQNDDAFVMGIPYIVVDNPLSMVLAREAFGLAKDLGAINVPFAQNDPNLLSVAVLGVKDVAAADARYAMQPLMEVRRVGKPNPDILKLADGLADAFVSGNVIESLEQGLLDLIQLGGLAAHTVGLLIAGDFRLLSLKQFREEVTNVEACHQEVVAVHNTITRRGGFRHLASTYEVEFFHLDSHPLARDLGLSGVHESKLSFFMDYDFSIAGRPYP
jgi:hypothetical protein